MNVVFISPHFPLYFHNFCSRLKERGVNVLGIGDEDYNLISNETKNAVTEYYKVSNLENFEEVENACKFYENKYGKIDWIESQNEYWLEMEATLRSKFNVNTGTKIENMSPMKYKSKMKDVYKKANIPVARYDYVKTLESCIDFANKVGYPIIAKPDNGVGANSTYKLNNEDEIRRFFNERDESVVYIIEEFIKGHVETFDGIADSNKNVLIASSHVMLSSIMDCVNEKQEARFYCQPVKNRDIETIGKKAVKAFDTRSRFFHFEFFRLDEDKEGLGKKGDLIGLEVNMRAPGGCIIDMINYAYDVDVFTIWADMLVHNKCFYDINRKYLVGYTSRRNNIDYLHSMDEVYEKYGDKIVANMDIPKIFADAMGDNVLLFRTKSKDEIFEIVDFILKHRNEVNWVDKYMAL